MQPSAFAHDSALGAPDPAGSSADPKTSVVAVSTPGAGRRTSRIALAIDQMPRISRVTRLTETDWAPALLIFLCDIVCWFSLYAGLAFLRHQAVYSSALELGLIDGLQLIIIVQCLFIIGGYSSRTDMRSL